MFQTYFNYGRRLCHNSIIKTNCSETQIKQLKRSKKIKRTVRKMFPCLSFCVSACCRAMVYLAGYYAKTRWVNKMFAIAWLLTGYDKWQIIRSFFFSWLIITPIYQTKKASTYLDTSVKNKVSYHDMVFVLWECTSA